MRPLSEMNIIQIEVTNACYLKCANCTRHVGHHKKTFFMDLDYIEKAIDSLEGFEGNIGMMGEILHCIQNFRKYVKSIKKKFLIEEKENFGLVVLNGKNIKI